MVLACRWPGDDQDGQAAGDVGRAAVWGVWEPLAGCCTDQGAGLRGIKGAACGWIGGKLQASSQFVRVYHDSNFRFVMLVLALGIQRNFLQASKIGADKKQLQPHFLANSSTPPSC